MSAATPSETTLADWQAPAATGGSGFYSYDALGNIKTRTEGGQAMTYHYNYTVHRLTSISGPNTQSFSYDAYGNVTGNGSHGFTYNRAA